MESSGLDSRGPQREASRTTAGCSTHNNSSQRLQEQQRQSLGQVRLEVYSEVLLLLDRADVERSGEEAVRDVAWSVVSGLDCLSELCTTRWAYQFFDSRRPQQKRGEKSPGGTGQQLSFRSGLGRGDWEDFDNALKGISGDIKHEEALKREVRLLHMSSPPSQLPLCSASLPPARASRTGRGGGGEEGNPEEAGQEDGREGGWMDA